MTFLIAALLFALSFATLARPSAPSGWGPFAGSDGPAAAGNPTGSFLKNPQLTMRCNAIDL